MKSLSITLALALTAVSALPAAAELFPQPVLSDAGLAGLNAVHDATTSSLFAQTSVSVNSTAIASVLPGTGQAAPSTAQATYTDYMYMMGSQLAYDASGEPLYLKSGTQLGAAPCTLNCLEAYGSAGQLLYVQYSTDDLAAPTAADSATLAGVAALTNLAGSALNSLTISVDPSVLLQPLGTVPSQLAIADTSTTTANLSVPNVTAGMATMSNTALGAVNTITVSGPSIQIPN